MFFCCFFFSILHLHHASCDDPCWIPSLSPSQSALPSHNKRPGKSDKERRREAQWRRRQAQKEAEDNRSFGGPVLFFSWGELLMRERSLGLFGEDGRMPNKSCRCISETQVMMMSSWWSFSFHLLHLPPPFLHFY